MTTEEQPEKQQDDPSALSVDVGKGGLKIRLPEKLFRYIGPRAIPWSILMISAAVALYIIAKAAALVVGAPKNVVPEYRDARPSESGDLGGAVMPYRRGAAPGISFWA
jgi:hypothetical protein